MTATDLELIAATARRMDALVAALAAECAKGEAGQGWVSCRVIRRLLGEVARACGPCGRGQHGCCDRGPYMPCDCAHGGAA